MLAAATARNLSEGATQAPAETYRKKKKVKLSL
jgi:hypothetical protein